MQDQRVRATLFVRLIVVFFVRTNKKHEDFYSSEEIACAFGSIPVETNQELKVLKN